MLAWAEEEGTAMNVNGRFGTFPRRKRVRSRKESQSGGQKSQIIISNGNEGGAAAAAVNGIERVRRGSVPAEVVLGGNGNGSVKEEDVGIESVLKEIEDEIHTHPVQLPLEISISIPSKPNPIIPVPVPVPKTSQEESLTTTIIDPKTLVSKTLSTIYYSSIHPTLVFTFTDGSKYQLLVRNYVPLPPPSLPRSPTLTPSPVAIAAPADEVTLDLPPVLEALLNPGQSMSVNLRLAECVSIRLTDKAFEKKKNRQLQRQSSNGSSSQSPPQTPSTVSFTSSSLSTASTSSTSPIFEDEEQNGAEVSAEYTTQTKKWNQNHHALALKFEGVEGWHCISAIRRRRNTLPPSPQAQSPLLGVTTTDADGEVYRSYEDVFLRIANDKKMGQHYPRRFGTGRRMSGFGMSGGAGGAVTGTAAS